MWMVTTNMNKIILLGSSGFIGKNISEFFHKRIDNFIDFGSKECDLLDIKSMNQKLSFLQNNDTIIIASSITRLIDNSINSMNDNVLMVQNLIDILQNKPVKHLIFFSSVDVYGLIDESISINENLSLNPNDYYATSKLVSEIMFQTFCKQAGIKLTILRCSGIYGNGDLNKSTINKIFETIKTTNSIQIIGDGSLLRDFVYIDDLLSLLNEVIYKEVVGTINIATGNSISILELSKKIFRILDIEENVIYKMGLKEDTQRVFDMSYDIKILKDKLPDFSFNTMDLNLLKYIKNNLE